MSANRIFLVCSKHPAIEDALLIADRYDANSQYYPPQCRCLGKCLCGQERGKRESQWFAKHAQCGRPDHFKLAYHRPLDHDVPAQLPELAPASAGVKLAIINGSKPS